MSGLSRTPGKRVYGESRNEGSNPSLSANTQSERIGFKYNLLILFNKI